jgi:cell division inhibitor SepF
MALRDTWHRTLMYFGLADDEEYEDDLEPYQEPEVEAQHAYSDRSQNVRRDEFDDIFADDPEADRRTTSLRPVGSGRGNGRGGADRMHFVEPKNFNDVQDVADKFKDAIPVILNLQQTDHDLSKRLIDFSSGLT